jgi:hypothetical protein
MKHICISQHCFFTSTEVLVFFWGATIDIPTQVHDGGIHYTITVVKE